MAKIEAIMKAIRAALTKSAPRTIVGATKEEIEAAKKAEMAGAQASWDQIDSTLGTAASRVKTGYTSPASLGPDIAARNRPAKFPGVGEFQPPLGDALRMGGAGDKKNLLPAIGLGAATVGGAAGAKQMQAPDNIYAQPKLKTEQDNAKALQAALRRRLSGLPPGPDAVQ